MKCIIMSIFILLNLLACTANRYTPTQLKKMRTRYVNADYHTSFETCLEVLHDDNFEITMAAYESGVINAKRTKFKNSLLSLLDLIFLKYVPDPFKIHHLNILIQETKNDSSFVSLVVIEDRYRHATQQDSLKKSSSLTLSPSRSEIYHTFLTHLGENLRKKDCLAKGIEYIPSDITLQNNEYRISCNDDIYTGKILKSTNKLIYLASHKKLYIIDKEIIKTISDKDDELHTKTIMESKFKQKINFNRYQIIYIKE